MNRKFEITDEVMTKINEYAVCELSPEQVYCFSVVLCDNDIDRDYERFSPEALHKLAQLFKGRTGIFDHNPKGENQTARLFEAEVKSYEGRFTRDGLAYYALEGKAYMVRTDKNSDLIAEIEGGIKKEVSVSCSVGKEICSICGADRKISVCAHHKGEHYGEQLCFGTLDEPQDAYEWSFVAVPAQVNAGVTKRFDGVTEENDECSKLRNALGENQRKLSDACKILRSDILRMSYFCKPYHSGNYISAMTEKMNFAELVSLRKSMEQDISQNMDKLEREEKSFITELTDENDDSTNNSYTVD